MAGALLYAPIAVVRAQVVTQPPTAVPIPVKPKPDSVPDSAKVKLDSIKAPIGRFADPALYEIGPQYEWNRTQLFATGALTVAELLDRIPGVTTFKSGWLAAPQTASYAGDFQRVRIFYDGMEIDNLDNRTGGVLDLTSVQLWSLEHLSIERTGSEIRIYMRSWRVDNTDPYTRVDVATGNEDTNLYRGFYGKRFDNGAALQFAGQQYGVTSSRFAGSGDDLALLGRVGVGRKSWSIDAFVLRNHATRAIQRPIATSQRPPVLALDATYTDAYVRAAVGGVNSGPWAQVTVASLGFKGTTEPDRSVGTTPLADTLERRRSETQYNVSAGMTLGALRLEAEDRLRALGSATYHNASGRADLVSPIGTVSGFVERDGFRGTTTADAGIRAQPLPFLAVSGSVTHFVPNDLGTGTPASTNSFRGEAAIKLFGPWVSAGVIRTDRTSALAPLAYDTLLLATGLGRVTGKTVSIRGPVLAGFGIDAWLVQWDPTGPYLPKYESRSELNYTNNFERRFPRGDFQVKAAASYDYRSHADFPLAGGDVQTGVAKTLSAMLEIRIIRAVIYYQQRNIMGYQYQLVPGFEQPRVLAIYGVRWDFWN